MSNPDQEFPIAGYDQLSPGELSHRIRSLPTEELEQLFEYEREHASRPLVMEMMSARLDELATGSAPATGGDPRPGRAEATRGTSPVTPQTAPQPFSSPPHGSPHQQGQPKGDLRRP